MATLDAGSAESASSCQVARPGPDADRKEGALALMLERCPDDEAREQVCRRRVAAFSNDAAAASCIDAVSLARRTAHHRFDGAVGLARSLRRAEIHPASLGAAD